VAVACAPGRPGAADVAPPVVTGPATEACRRLGAALPGRLDGLDRRRTKPASPLTAAWGDPPVVLRCGVPRPAALRATSQLVVVNDVDWFPEERDEGYVFTTSGRVANIEVTVPAEHRPEADVLVDLAGPVRSQVRPVPPAGG
jgi:Protein of unknown function (DUF3515)